MRDLVNHLTGEQLWVPELLMGATISEVGGRFDGDVLGDDPVAAWTAAADAAREAFAVPGATELVVHLSFGDVPGQYYLDQLTTDAVVHSWDLAEGIGRGTRLPEELVDFALAEFMRLRGPLRQRTVRPTAPGGRGRRAADPAAGPRRAAGPPLSGRPRGDRGPVVARAPCAGGSGGSGGRPGCPGGAGYWRYRGAHRTSTEKRRARHEPQAGHPG